MTQLLVFSNGDPREYLEVEARLGIPRPAYRFINKGDDNIHGYLGRRYVVLRPLSQYEESYCAEHDITPADDAYIAELKREYGNVGFPAIDEASRPAAPDMVPPADDLLQQIENIQYKFGYGTTANKKIIAAVQARRIQWEAAARQSVRDWFTNSVEQTGPPWASKDAQYQYEALMEMLDSHLATLPQPVAEAMV